MGAGALAPTPAPTYQAPLPSQRGWGGPRATSRGDPASPFSAKSLQVFSTQNQTHAFIFNVTAKVILSLQNMHSVQDGKHKAKGKKKSPATPVPQECSWTCFCRFLGPLL